MKVYRKGSGEEYTPFNHFEMTTQAIFNKSTGSDKVNVTLSTLKKGTGSSDEVHEHSDQVFYMIQGELLIYAKGELKERLTKGDAILVKAGDVHAVKNEKDEDCVYCAITVPPLESTH